MSRKLLIYFLSLILITSILFLLSGFNKKLPINKYGRFVIHFLNIADGKKIAREGIYKNTFGEAYTVSKLKYYISNVHLDNFIEKQNYHLIDAFSSDSFSISLPPGNYNNFSFLLGVDSIKNCSGAQSGALDPLNDMFWTWSNGYVMFKLEGTSASSIADLHRIEQHIGGYKGLYKTMREIDLSLAANTIIITGYKTQNITIQVDLDKYWKGVNEIKITVFPVLSTTGEQAKKAADNFPGMFSVQRINIHKN